MEIEAIDVAEHVPCLTKIPSLSYSSKDMPTDELKYTIEYLYLLVDTCRWFPGSVPR